MSELKRVRGERVLVETVSEVVTVSLFLSLSLSIPPFLQAAHGYILLVPKMLYTVHPNFLAVFMRKTRFSEAMGLNNG